MRAFPIPLLGLPLAILTACSGPPPVSPTPQCPTDRSAEGTSSPQSPAPLDRGAVAGALACVKVQSCKLVSAAPRGAGHIVVRFDPNGTIVDARVDQPPYAGTDIGRCIEDRFRVARIPPFAGEPVPVGKSFVLQ